MAKQKNVKQPNTTSFNKKLILNGLFCVDGVLSVDDLINGLYDDELLIHTGYTFNQFKDDLSINDWKMINDFINESNYILYT